MSSKTILGYIVNSVVAAISAYSLWHTVTDSQFTSTQGFEYGTNYSLFAFLLVFEFCFWVAMAAMVYETKGTKIVGQESKEIKKMATYVWPIFFGSLAAVGCLAIILEPDSALDAYTLAFSIVVYGGIRRSLALRHQLNSKPAAYAYILESSLLPWGVACLLYLIFIGNNPYDTIILFAVARLVVEVAMTVIKPIFVSRRS